MGGHQPLQPQVYERMPPQVRELMPGVTGSRREDVYEYSKAPWLKADESMAEWAARSGLPPGGVKPLSPQELGSATEHLARHGYAVLHGRIPARATGNEQAQAPVADQLARRCRELCQQAAAAAAGPAESASYGLLNHDARCASLALSPLPLIFSYKSEKSLCGAAHFAGSGYPLVGDVKHGEPPLSECGADSGSDTAGRLFLHAARLRFTAADWPDGSAERRVRYEASAPLPQALSTVLGGMTKIESDGGVGAESQ